MIRAAFVFAVLASATAPAVAQDTAVSLNSITALATGPCMFAETGDIATPLAAARVAVRDLGLPVMVENDQTAMYGAPGGTLIVVNAGVDEIACTITLSPPVGDHATFEMLEASIDAEFSARHPNHKENTSNDPSPHVDGHGWVTRTAANDQLAMSLNFTTERGVTIAAGIQKKYD